ncbi:2-C-methyl-D-erythritol 4-phosphate cytidylyltransferase [Butyrivibrio sp. MC2013]|uniref:2-C-methyl-D-erythritol 4-phosphate cytidylyltransferase n=1 Tax=Butyrivibrio sp. MC2013 TaxID=1280686 RepID=UPI000425D771|nr:2-C-methyl-D-erythritol 4-phosphate cytidylyltransferase [Butyrivibrio sp. MC2013]
MNTALIFAGGTGKRMNSKAVPKQFLMLYGKPLIIYTLEKFENHPDIDAIVISCLESWIPQMKNYCEKYDIRKVRAIVPGGASGQESIYNGLRAASSIGSEKDIVLIHDGVRPLVDPGTISAAVKCTQESGNAITVTPAIETIFLDNGQDGEVGRIIDRKQCLMARAPQCFHLGDILAAHERARSEKIDSFIDSASMMKHYGHRLYTVEGKAENIKITTPVDFYMFRAIIDARENQQIFGL